MEIAQLAQNRPLSSAIKYFICFIIILDTLSSNWDKGFKQILWTFLKSPKRHSNHDSLALLLSIGRLRYIVLMQIHVVCETVCSGIRRLCSRQSQKYPDCPQYLDQQRRFRDVRIESLHISTMKTYLIQGKIISEKCWSFLKNSRQDKLTMVTIP